LLQIVDKAGHVYTVERVAGNVYYVRDAKTLVARAALDPARGLVSEIVILRAWRRRGIASALCGAIERKLGRPLKPLPRTVDRASCPKGST
jgi:predicted GNAT family acetyltransferase